MPKDTFFQIKPEKRDRIIEAATELFADRGFHRTDVSRIAERAGVAKGSLYNYFESKEEIYLYVCRHGLDQSRQAVYSGIQAKWDVFRRIRHIFESGAAFVRTNPEYIRLYLNYSSAGLARFTEPLSNEVEAFTSDYLKHSIVRGIEAGIVSRDLDVNVAAFLINSLYIMFVVSLAEGHFQNRLKTYLEITGEPTPDRTREIIERLLEMIERMLRPERSPLQI